MCGDVVGEEGVGEGAAGEVEEGAALSGGVRGVSGVCLSR